jgi:hypothetical protein
MKTFAQFVAEDNFRPGGPMYIVGHEKYYDQIHKGANNQRRIARRNVNNLQNTPLRKDSLTNLRKILVII